MTRVYTIWPANRKGTPALASNAWHQDAHWLVLDISDGIDDAHIVEGPVTRQVALRRELELRATARQISKTTHRQNADQERP